jgi:hypothetical protein
LTPLFSDDENNRSAKTSTPIPSGELCCVRSRSVELACCWTFADERRLYEMVLGYSSPTPQFSVDQGNDAEQLA